MSDTDAGDKQLTKLFAAYSIPCIIATAGFIAGYAVNPEQSLTYLDKYVMPGVVISTLLFLGAVAYIGSRSTEVTDNE